ncbi:hypothetical protein D3C74_451360 [compost metagenome]
MVLGNGEVFLLDEDELEEALEREDITDSDYNLAWATAKSILRSIDAHAFPYFALSLKHRAELFHHGEFRRK